MNLAVFTYSFPLVLHPVPQSTKCKIYSKNSFINHCYCNIFSLGFFLFVLFIFLRGGGGILFIYLFICLFVYLFIHLFIYLFIYLFVYFWYASSSHILTESFQKEKKSRAIDEAERVVLAAAKLLENAIKNHGHVTNVTQILMKTSLLLMKTCPICSEFVFFAKLIKLPQKQNSISEAIFAATPKNPDFDSVGFDYCY